MQEQTSQTVLGFLVDDLLSQYQVRLLMGLQRAARRHGVRLLSIPAGWFSASPPARFDGSFLFKLARPPMVHGVIVEASILATEVGVDAVQHFCRALELPVVSVSRLDGFPWVDSNAAAGLREAIEHLVFVHGRRRLCFIQGPPGNSHSQERGQVFRSVLLEHGIAVDQNWILPGDFLENSGARAISTLLDERGVAISDIDGIVAANDLMAVGALEELTARGVYVPRDVALVGFDDDDLARNADPPITTVAQLVERIGSKAVELLLRVIAGESVDHANLVDVELVVRRSCGCGEVGLSKHPPHSSSLEELHAIVKSQAPACRHYLEVFFDDSTGSDGVEAAIELVNGTPSDSPQQFRTALERAIRDAMSQGLDPLRWHDVFQPIRVALARHAHVDGAPRFDARFGEMKLIVSELAAQIKASDALRSAQDASALRVMGSVLVSSRDFTSFNRVLRAALPGLGVRLCCVCLFEGNADESMAVRVAALVASEGSMRPAPIQRTPELWATLQGGSDRRTMAHDLDSPVVEWPLSITERENGNLVVFPLVFAEEPMGYVIFSEPHQARDAWLLEGIAGHLSSAIHTMRNAERLRSAREVAEAANSAKGEFVAMMSHEIRTPLTAVMGQLDLTLREDVSGDVRRRLELARSSSKALLGIVNNLLDFSKMDAGRLEVERVRFRFDEVLDQVIGATGIAAAHKGLELVVDADPEIPELLLGDPLRLSQILVNLVGNSVKFSFQGEIVLRVEICGASRVGETILRFTVRDTGIGMTTSELSRIFQPFTQGDSSTTRRHGGTGLGLAISQRLVELLGGTLSVISNKGHGSCFAFEIPFSSVTSPRDTANVNALRVLLAEDNESQRVALRRALVALGCTVTEVGSLDGFTEALNASTDSFEITVVDATLSGRDTETVLELAKTAGAAGHLIALYPMHHSAAESARVHDLQEVEFVVKPLTSRRIQDIIRFTCGPTTPHAALARDREAQTKPVLLERRRVLLVQDNEVSREVFQQLLQQFGLQVRTASDGGQAVHEALTHQFDIVLMDLHLPGLDGFEAARAIRVDPRYSLVPIVALTASQAQDIRARCIAAGMNDCLTTPIEPDDLKAALELWLGKDGQFNAAVLHSLPPAATLDDGLREPRNCLDHRRGIQRVGGQEDDYRRVLSRFVDVHADTAEQIAEDLRLGQHDSALFKLHAYVSAAGNIGAASLFRATRELEESIKTDGNNYAKTLVRNLVHVATQTNDEALAWLVTDNPATVAVSTTDERCQQMIDEMAELLLQHDTSALANIDTLCSCLESRAGNEVVRSLNHLVHCYDFERASECLDSIRSCLDGYLSK